MTLDSGIHIAHCERNMANESSRRRKSVAWVGPWLRQVRLDENKETTEQVAARLGVGRSSVSRMESGASSIPADDLPLVLRAYDVSPSRFAARAAKRAA